VEAFGSEEAMRVIMPDLFNRLALGAGVVALAALVWGIAVPSGVAFTAALVVGLVGAAIATRLVVRSRQVPPTLAQMVTGATAETGLVPVPIRAARAASGSAR
jgi:hypothetical protein